MSNIAVIELTIKLNLSAEVEDHSFNIAPIRPIFAMNEMNDNDNVVTVIFLKSKRINYFAEKVYQEIHFET